MTEPVASATTGIAIAAGTLTITGSILGVQYEALLAGLFGGLCYLSYSPTVSKLRLSVNLATSSLMAGFFAPILMVGVLNYFPYLSKAGETPLRIAVAAWIGLVSQSAVPFLLKKLNKKIEGPNASN